LKELQGQASRLKKSIIIGIFIKKHKFLLGLTSCYSYGYKIIKARRDIFVKNDEKNIVFLRISLHINAVKDSSGNGLILLNSQEENQMRKRTVLLTVVSAVAFLGRVAQGGLISFYSDTFSTWSPSGVVFTQVISGYEPVSITMSAEAQSTFTFTTITTNESDITWTGYVLSLDPEGAASFVDETAGSTKFETALYPDALTIEFWAPNEVLPGQVVTLQFDVSIPDDVPCTITLTQNPIPEPATIVLLAFGGAALLYKRQRNI
jgi:hypothetical protein